MRFQVITSNTRKASKVLEEYPLLKKFDLEIQKDAYVESLYINLESLRELELFANIFEFYITITWCVTPTIEINKNDY